MANKKVFIVLYILMYAYYQKNVYLSVRYCIPSLVKHNCTQHVFIFECVRLHVGGILRGCSCWSHPSTVSCNLLVPCQGCDRKSCVMTFQWVLNVGWLLLT